MNVVKTVLVDSQVMFVEGLCHIIEKNLSTIKIVEKCQSAARLIEVINDQEVHLIIMDLNMDDMDSMNLIKEVKRSNKEIRILVLSSYSDWRYIKESFMKGADGYMDKRAAVEEFVDGVAQVLMGYRYLGNGLSITPSRVTTSNKEQKSQYHDKFMLKQSLTKREAEILVLITQAKSNKEIGEDLFISDQTVGVHRRNIMRKLGVKNTVNLVKVAYENQLV